MGVGVGVGLGVGTWAELVAGAVGAELAAGALLAGELLAMLAEESPLHEARRMVTAIAPRPARTLLPEAFSMTALYVLGPG